MTISSVTSEALQLKLRQLLPSQQGFGTDLSASDTIVPIIDLTASAEGSDTRQDLQTALAYGSQTTFQASNGTAVIANTTGFWRCTGSAAIKMQGGGNSYVNFIMTDGAAPKTLWTYFVYAGAADTTSPFFYDFIFYLAAGESFEVFSFSTEAEAFGSVRQIADSNGALIQPVGFTPS